jgi:hypothetical protein
MLFVVFASPALAMEMPGGPPWSCHPISACDSNKVCVSVSGPPMSFELHPVENEENKYTLKGIYGYEGYAVVFPIMEDARHFVETDRSENLPPIILIPNKLMADAYGFSAYRMAVRGTGERLIMPEYLNISCNSAPKQR